MRNRTVSTASISVLLTLLALVSSEGAHVARAAGRGEPGPVFPARIGLTDETAQLQLLHDLDIDVDGVFEGWARAYLIQEELEKLRGLGFGITPIPEELLLPGRFEPAGPDAPSRYHTYATLTADLQQVATDHPAITRLFSLGQSEQGRELWMMKITANPDVDEFEPEVAYISSMHGDEVVGKELCFNLIDHLTDNYGSDPRVTDLVDDSEIWIMPSMNPDGTELGWRYNANFVDLNRDFPDQFVDPVNTTAGRAAETAAVMNWHSGRHVGLSLNYHGGALVANYPFDSNTAGSSIYSPSPDDDVFVSISRTYADNNPPMSTSNGHPSFNNGTCNGADWYAISGGLQDWGYVWYGDFDVTLEVSQTKWPAASTLPTFWSENLESMLSYLERAREGLRGIVTDARTGLPLAATLTPVDSGFPTYADPALGDYHRLMLPGNYTVEVSAPGYSTEMFDVTVPAGPALRRDVVLQPLAPNLRPVEGCAEGVSGCDPWLIPGQTTDLAVTLRNLGVSSTQIAGKLVPTGWYADVTRAGATYPDLAPGGQGTSDAPHHGVSVSPGVPAGHKIGFALDWTTGEGSGLSEPFFVPFDAATCSSVTPNDLPSSILDRQTTTSQASFPTDQEIAGLTVRVDIAHGYRSDLRVELLSPAGTSVTLHDRSGGSADDIVGTYGVDLVPFEPLDRLAGESSLGDWKLQVDDGVPGNTGLLNDWSLEICGRPFEATPPEMRLRDLRVEPDGIAIDWWAYPGLTSYRVYRSADPASAGAFTDVSGQDGDDGDTTFKDTSAEPVLFWLVTGVGSNGEGPRGHFGQ